MPENSHALLDFFIIQLENDIVEFQNFTIQFENVIVQLEKFPKAVGKINKSCLYLETFNWLFQVMFRFYIIN